MQGHNPALKARSQELRRLQNATKQERHLWYDFLRKYKPQFHRQVIFQQFIVDFYCPQAKLVIELDGSQHYEKDAIEYDRQRTAILEGLGCRVIRYSNSDVDYHFRSVCEDIDRRVQMLLKVEKQL